MLSIVGILSCKVKDVPMDPNLKLSAEQGGLLEDQGIYEILVGKLNFWQWQLDVAYLVCIVSQFM